LEAKAVVADFFLLIALLSAPRLTQKKKQNENGCRMASPTIKKAGDRQAGVCVLPIV